MGRGGGEGEGIMTIELTMRMAAQEGLLCAPVGLSTPRVATVSVSVEGAAVRLIADPTNGQTAMALTPTAEDVTIRWGYRLGGAAYPEAMFAPRDSRYIRAAAALAEEARGIASAAGGGRAGLRALVDHVTGLFRYGHPEERFYEGSDDIPQLCGLTEGSCVDINAYLIAAARAAGYEAGYMTGCFIPEGKRDWCEDMHCWVVTRVDGVVQDWDIAHHLKMGVARVEPGLNPRPGVRVPLSHSMGWVLPDIGVADLKLLAEPLWFRDGRWLDAEPRITLAGYDLLAG